MSAERFSPGGFRASREWCSRERAFVLLALMMALALGLRLDFLIANNFVIDADEAIVGLMAMHISQGSAWPAFYYGQHYMGSLEPLLVAALFRIWGPSSGALVSIPLMFSIWMVPLVYLIARTISGRLGALAAALLMAVPPTGLVVWSAKARGGFIEVIVLGALALLFTARWLKSEQRELSQTALIGFLLGLGWWTNNQVVFFMLPIGFMMTAALLQGPSTYLREPLIVRVRQVVQHGGVGLAAFLAGGLPFWMYNLSNDFASFGMFSPAGTKDLSAHIEGLFTIAIPMLLGAKRFWQHEDIIPHASLFAYVLLGIAVLSYVVARLRNVVALAALKVDAGRPVELFSLFVLGSLCTFALSSYGWLFEAPRYLLPVYVGLFVLLGFLIEHWYGYARWFAFSMLTLFLGLHLLSSYWNGRALPGEPHVYNGQRVEKDHSALLAWLESTNVPWIRTNYWIGYRVAFETQEKTRFVPFHEPYHERIPEYAAEAKLLDRGQMPLVLVPAQGELVERALKALGLSYETASLSGYQVLWGVKRNIEPGRLVSAENFVASSSNTSMDPGLAVDQNLESRWGTGEPQHPGQEFRITFNEPRQVNAIAFDFGKWPHDFPRGLQIEFGRTDGTVEVFLPSANWEAVRYYNEHDSRFLFSFPQKQLTFVRFVQTGEDSVFDWSLAEVQAYGMEEEITQDGVEPEQTS